MSSARITIVGAGPGAVMVLERLLASHRTEHPELGLEVHLVDPHEPGGGRIWRRTQSPLLKLNSMLEDVAFFTDSSCEIEGPIEPGPSLADWVRGVRAGEYPAPEWADGVLFEELASIGNRDFPTRRLNNAYLTWCYEETLRRRAETATVTWLQDTVIAVEPADPASASDPGAHTVRLASGGVLAADVVLYAVGHNGSEPSRSAAHLTRFADANGFNYVAPAFTADVDLDWVQAGENVIVRGMGLAAVDLTVLLTEGRGGRFEPTPEGGLRYLPSGSEPRLFLGSRRGVPYRSKVASRVAGEPVRLEYLPEWLAQTAERAEGTLDFERDAWPIIAAEMLTGYYRELFTAHPERVRGEWTAASQRLREILSEAGGHESAALEEFVRELVPDVNDRFLLGSFDRPLSRAPEIGGSSDGSYDATASTKGASSVTDRVCQHIAQDLLQRSEQEHSANQALFVAALYCYMAIADVPAERWNAASRVRELPKRWHSYFSYFASGPPAHRLHEMLALADAGVLHFIGSDVELTLDPEGFIARGRAALADGEAREQVVAHTLIDAWLPDAQAAKSDNPLLRDLVARGTARELSVSDESFSGTTGQLVVGPGGVLRGSPRQFAMGPFTSIPTAGAFTRPGMNSLPFRTHDRAAQAVLSAAVHQTVAAGHTQVAEPASDPATALV